MATIGAGGTTDRWNAAGTKMWEDAEVGPRADLGDDSMLGLIENVYDATLDGKHWSKTLQAVRTNFHGNSCAIASYDIATDVGRQEISCGANDAVSRWLSQHPNITMDRNHSPLFNRPGQIWTGREILADPEQASDHPAVTEVQSPFVFHSMRGVLDCDGPMVFYLGLRRVPAAGAFRPEEIAQFRRLVPHVQRSFKVWRRFGRTVAMQETAEESVNALPIGVIIVARGGRILHENDAAREILSAGDGLCLDGDRVDVVEADERQRFHDFIASAAGSNGRAGEARAFLSVTRQSGQKPLSVVISPVRSRTEALSIDRPTAILFVSDPTRRTEMRKERLMRLYTLTGAEARVAAHLAEGRRLDEISRLLGISDNTIRTHLKRIFTKTGTERQAELVRMLVTGPAPLRLS